MNLLMSLLNEFAEAFANEFAEAFVFALESMTLHCVQPQRKTPTESRRFGLV